MKKIFGDRGFLFSISLGVLSILGFGVCYFLSRLTYAVSTLSPDSLFPASYLTNAEWILHLSPTAKYILYLPLVLAILFFGIGIYILYKNRKSEKL